MPVLPFLECCNSLFENVNENLRDTVMGSHQGLFKSCVVSILFAIETACVIPVREYWFQWFTIIVKLLFHGDYFLLKG